MRRVLFEWRGRKLCAYPALLFAGIVLGIPAGTRVAGQLGIDSMHAYAALLLLVPVALVGARLLYVALHWSADCRPRGVICRRSEGGAALYGGLLLAVAASWPMLCFLHVAFWAFWDAATVTMLVGLVFGRVGCLLNGCCAGRPTASRFGLLLPNARGEWCRRVPTQVLEALLAAALLVSSLTELNQFSSRGELFLGALACYAGARWALESGKETADRLGRFSVYRVVSAALAGLSVLGLVMIRLHGSGVL